MEANVAFYLVEASTSKSVQCPVAIGADEVNAGVIFHKFSILHVK